MFWRFVWRIMFTGSLYFASQSLCGIFIIQQAWKKYSAILHAKTANKVKTLHFDWHCFDLFFFKDAPSCTMYKLVQC